MSKRRYLDDDVFNVAIQRIIELYQEGSRVIVAFSAGKDSGVMLELARIAAKVVGIPQVEVFMCDDEIMLPGTFEYAERIAEQPDIKFDWAIARQPMPNVFNREIPYWWVFDWKLEPEQWVRKPPSYARVTDIIDLYNMISPKYYPPPEGKKLYSLVGTRVTESKNRLLNIHSVGGFVSKWCDRYGVYKAMPIYDWTEGDVWRAVHTHKWDYNHAYDVMLKMGMNKKSMRIAPPTMAWYGADQLRMAAHAWPKWFDRVCDRCPGVRQVVYYGLRAVMPTRYSNETWEQCYKRECIQTAPQWIRERSILAMEHMLNLHAVHSTQPFPEVTPCGQCSGTGVASWQQLANILFTGDPYSLKAHFLDYVLPNTFRPDDTRIWDSRPSGGR